MYVSRALSNGQCFKINNVILTTEDCRSGITLNKLTCQILLSHAVYRILALFCVILTLRVRYESNSSWSAIIIILYPGKSPVNV